jgi:hypothetical protein
MRKRGLPSVLLARRLPGLAGNLRGRVYENVRRTSDCLKYKEDLLVYLCWVTRLL